MTILDALTTHPQTKRELAIVLGWHDKKGKPDTRRVETDIQSSRLRGLPIASNGSGYWFTNDPEELRDCADWLMGKIKTQAATPRALRRTARRLDEQRDLVLFKDVA